MEPRVAAGSTYVQISREELEDWLNSVWGAGKWERDPRYAGVYLLNLSPSVAVKLSSTIGSANDAMERGKASMQLSLFSTATGRTLNKKAQGQDHFKRTINWKKTWAAGIDVMKKAYLSSSDFYDAISVIQDRDRYREDLMKRIESVPGWDNDGALIGIYRKVERGGVLMKADLEDIEEAEKRPKQQKPPPPAQNLPPGNPGDGMNFRDPRETKELRLDALRKLWVFAKRNNDEWTMNFAQDVAQKFVEPNRHLSAPQLKVLAGKMERYRVLDKNGDRADRLF